MQGEITLDMVKRRIRYLYEHHPDIHLNYHIRSKIQLENIPATIVGVYPHLFVVSESGHGYDKQCTLKYTDVLIGQIEIAELN